MIYSLYAINLPRVSCKYWNLLLYILLRGDCLVLTSPWSKLHSSIGFQTCIRKMKMKMKLAFNRFDLMKVFCDFDYYKCLNISLRITNKNSKKKCEKIITSLPCNFAIEKSVFKIILTYNIFNCPSTLKLLLHILRNNLRKISAVFGKERLSIRNKDYQTQAITH